MNLDSLSVPKFVSLKVAHQLDYPANLFLETIMKVFSGHFVSQKLGRGQCTVDTYEPDQVFVMVSFDEPLRTFRGSLLSPELCMGAANNRPQYEFAARVAISQACHHWLRNPDSAGELALTLNLHEHPWVGDFTAAAYGGATNGFAASDGAIPARIVTKMRRSPPRRGTHAL